MPRQTAENPGAPAINKPQPTRLTGVIFAVSPATTWAEQEWKMMRFHIEVVKGELGDRHATICYSSPIYKVQCLTKISQVNAVSSKSITHLVFHNFEKNILFF